MAISAPVDERSYQALTDFLRRVKWRLVQRAIVAALTRTATLLALSLFAWIGLEALLFLNPLWRTAAA